MGPIALVTVIDGLRGWGIHHVGFCHWDGEGVSIVSTRHNAATIIDWLLRNSTRIDIPSRDSRGWSYMVEDGRIICAAIKSDGQPCGATASFDRYCIGHAPQLEGKRQEARKLGGRNKSTAKRMEKMAPSRLAPIAKLLEEAIQDVRSGELEPKQGHAIATLSAALVRVVTIGEVDEMIRKLQSQFEQLQLWDGIE